MLGMFVPFVIGTFSTPDLRRRINPVVAGLLFGIMMTLYPNFLMAGVLGVLFVMIHGWRTAESRPRYLRDALLCVGIAALVSCWYLVPLLVNYVSGTQEVVADLFLSGTLLDQLPLFSAPEPIIYALGLIGAAGLLLFWRRAWWAVPIGLLSAGFILAKALMLARFVATGHHFLLLYIPYVLRYTATALGVLTLWEAGRIAGRRYGVRLAAPPRLIQVGAVTAAVVYLGWFANLDWRVSPGGLDGEISDAAVAAAPKSRSWWAHAQYRPDLTRPQYSTPEMAPGFPANEAASYISTVRRQGGLDARPVVLSFDQRLFSYFPYSNYLPTSRTSSSAMTQWDSRNIEVSRLAQITDPDQFASASASTAF